MLDTKNQTEFDIINQSGKYKILFIAANGLLSSTFFDDRHTIYFRNGYMEAEREIMGFPRIVFSVKEDRISKVYRYGQLVWDQHVGYLGAH